MTSDVVLSPLAAADNIARLGINSPYMDPHFEALSQEVQKFCNDAAQQGNRSSRHAEEGRSGGLLRFEEQIGPETYFRYALQQRALSQAQQHGLARSSGARGPLQ